MHNLSIDIETFSSVPISQAGMYRYVESNDFEILLLAYKLNDEPIQIIDLAQGELLPDWLYKAIQSPEYTKHAYNAAFEWRCLSKFYGYELPIEQWQDTMLHGLYCGFSGSLETLGKAIGISEEKQKLSVGKALIRYFCQPCSPTKSNGGRTRNLPRHDIDKWNLFKTYCMGDVLAESEIQHKLSNFKIPKHIEEQWHTDIKINARGVSVDLDLVNGALAIDQSTRDKLMAEAIATSGLDNPNSVSQLSKWIQDNTGIPIPDLRKETVDYLLSQNTLKGDAKRLLEIRQELGKTSTKKYLAVENAVCKDSKVRGLLQFYGANRTGRWAGRLVQVQNLPRTYIGQLDTARTLVKTRNGLGLKTLYGSISDSLSQLIRTVFVPSKGNVLIDADFSSIEARVISWLAKEQWRLKVFNTHGKIYEASASQMFGVPIERIKKGNPEYELRQKGKVAELALGYQGSSGALVSMGALKMGIPEDDLMDIVSRWRETNKRIVDLWYSLENAAIEAIRTGRSIGVNGLILSREIDLNKGLDFLTITLPSKRKLFYAFPKLGANKWGNTSILYYGMNQTTKQWTVLETYGGKLVENVVQAIARDCLAVAIERLEAAGFPVVFHVHDEVVIDCPKEKADLDKVISIISTPISWAKDLPLAADGWIGNYFRKD